jgi:hypothetical protein
MIHGGCFFSACDPLSNLYTIVISFYFVYFTVKDHFFLYHKKVPRFEKEEQGRFQMLSY